MKMVRAYLRSIFKKESIVFYIVILGISLILGVLNNVRVASFKSVTWFGGQEVLEKPDGY